MKSVSIKAFLVGNAVSLIASALFTALISVLAVMAIPVLLPKGGFHVAEQRLAHSASFEAAGALVAVVVGSFLAGWIAARIAKKAELLNGTLSASAMILISLTELAFGPFFGNSPHVSPLLDFAISYGGPIYGLAGAYVAMHFASKSSSKTEKPSRREVAVTTLRWLCSVPAAIAAYSVTIVFMGVVSKSSPTLAMNGMVFAATTGVLVGVFVAPPKQRFTAFVLFTALTIFAAILKFIVASAIDDGHSTFHAYEILLDIIGCGMAYGALRKAFREPLNDSPSSMGTAG
jgi:hypothetical protein